MYTLIYTYEYSSSLKLSRKFLGLHVLKRLCTQWVLHVPYVLDNGVNRISEISTTTKQNSYCKNNRGYSYKFAQYYQHYTK